MASRVIHYIVGQLAAERISLKNPEDFIFGNLLPDCVDGPGGRKGAKARSHFWHYDTKNHTKGQNWHLFGTSMNAIVRMNYIWDICVIW